MFFNKNRAVAFDVIKLKLYKWRGFYIAYPLTPDEMGQLRSCFGGRKRYKLWETKSGGVLNKFDRWCKENNLHFLDGGTPNIPDDPKYARACSLLRMCIMQRAQRLATVQGVKLEDQLILKEVWGGHIDHRPQGSRWYCKDGFVLEMWNSL